MFSPITLLPLLALSNIALAQTTVQSIFLAAPSDNDQYVGSVVGTGSGLTTYAIACTSGGASCVTGTSITLTEGSNTFAFASVTSTGGVVISVQETCSVAGTTSATCVATASASADGTSSEATTTTTLGTDGFNMHPVTITAGASLLGGGGAASNTAGNAAPMVTGMGMLAGAAMGVVALL